MMKTSGSKKSNSARNCNSNFRRQVGTIFNISIKIVSKNDHARFHRMNNRFPTIVNSRSFPCRNEVSREFFFYKRPCRRHLCSLAAALCECAHTKSKSYESTGRKRRNSFFLHSLALSASLFLSVLAPSPVLFPPFLPFERSQFLSLFLPFAFLQAIAWGFRPFSGRPLVFFLSFTHSFSHSLLSKFLTHTLGFLLYFI